jgi:glutathione S-transferase
MIKLYHCKDARSLRCVWALEELGIPYELATLGYPPRLKSPDFLKINPTGTVPFLVDGTTAMRESAATLEYLAAKYGSGRLQIAPDEASFGAWLDWVHFGESALTAPLALRLRFTIFEPQELRIPRLGEDYANLYLDRLALIEAAVERQDYLCANRFTIADISVGYALFLATRCGLAERHTPAVSAYLGRLQSRPAFAAARKRHLADSNSAGG